eukprot:TRINITY_DN50961_c0_g1_i1.p1 TRINITY_DN50961_c0_g1~~TRINITY_DN50961_c0_g1_i1.p1  ORF type:complete len:439 (+),score=57.06 TRINITY_DN50961_c0_g1_i1:94-1410(+)
MVDAPSSEILEAEECSERSASPFECSAELPAESRWLLARSTSITSHSSQIEAPCSEQKDRTPSCRLPSLFHGDTEAAKPAAFAVFPAPPRPLDLADENGPKQRLRPKASRPQPQRQLRQRRSKINPRFFQEILPSEWAISPRPQSVLSDAISLPSPRCPNDILSASSVLREALGDAGMVEDMDDLCFFGNFDQSKADTDEPALYEVPVVSNKWTCDLQCTVTKSSEDRQCINESAEDELLTATNMVRCVPMRSPCATGQLLQDELANLTGKACGGRSTAWRSPCHTGGCARLPAIAQAGLELKLTHPADRDQNGSNAAEYQEQAPLPLQPDVSCADEIKSVQSAPLPPGEQEVVAGRVERGPARPKVPLYLRMQFQYQAQEQAQLAAAREQRLLGRMSGVARAKAALVPRRRETSRSSSKKLTRTKSTCPCPGHQVYN